MKRLVCLTLLSICWARAGEGDAIAWSRENIAAGKYIEAVEMLTKELKDSKFDAAKRREASMVLIEAQRIVGQLKEALEVCEGLIKADDKDIDAQLLKGELLTATGQYKEAREVFGKVIAEQPDNHRAWALRSIALRELGDETLLKESVDHFYVWNKKQAKYFQDEDNVKDPREYAYIGLGFQDENPKSAFEDGFIPAEEQMNKRGLKIPEILFWSATLAQSKYNFGLADQRFTALEKMRPKLPDALAGKASIVYHSMHKLDEVEKTIAEALKVNPRHVESLLVLGSVDFEEERYADAKKHIDTALETNPNNERALSMLALYHLEMNEKAKFDEVEARMKKLKPVCPDFYCNIGEMMENKRGFNTAAPYYKKAIELNPEYWRGYYGLGMNTSRQGAEGEDPGKDLLLTAFKKNKFNLWARNMIVSLDRIIGDKEQSIPPVYAMSKTKHFTLKYFNKEAEIVRPYIEEFAEAAYERQTKMFGFEPEGPLTIELCYSFQDQAARTVGLPNLGALGVCFGKLCTVVSPREGGKDHPPFNWKKVLEHEFGHVMVLQMSDFRVPRWYTEAFSTYLEDDSRIQSDQMMVNAIRKNEIKDIDKMNEYFRGNMLMAYVHGRYVIEAIDKEYGFKAHIKAIRLFAEGKKVSEALQEATGKPLAELNKLQHDFVKESFKSVRLLPSFNKADIVKLELAANEEKATPQDIVNLAVANLGQRKVAEAERLAKKALEKDEKTVDAINVLGLIAYQKKDYEAAKQHYQKSTTIDPARSFNAWHKLGVIYKKEGKTTKAIEAFEAARKSYPRYVGEDNPIHELPELYADLEPPQLDKALQVWRDGVRINTEDKDACYKGMKLAQKMKGPKAVVEFAEAHISIDPYKLEVHKFAGKAYEELKDFKHAQREFKVACAIDQNDVENWVNLARASKAAGDDAGAKEAAKRGLDIDNTVKELKDIMK